MTLTLTHARTTRWHKRRANTLARKLQVQETRCNRLVAEERESGCSYYTDLLREAVRRRVEIASALHWHTMKLPVPRSPFPQTPQTMNDPDDPRRVKWTRCKYCGAKLRRDHVGQYCPTENCQWQHGLPKEDDSPRSRPGLRPPNTPRKP